MCVSCVRPTANGGQPRERSQHILDRRYSQGRAESDELRHLIRRIEFPEDSVRDHGSKRVAYDHGFDSRRKSLLYPTINECRYPWIAKILIDIMGRSEE